MVTRIIAAVFFGVLFYIGVSILPQMLGTGKAFQKGLDFISKGEIMEFGDIDTFLVPKTAVIDEKGELEREAIEIVTMVGQKNIQTVLLTEDNKASGDEMARRLGAVKTFCETSDYMVVVKELESEGKKVLYTEDLWEAEEAIELGQTVKSAAVKNGFWTVIFGAGGVLTATNTAVIGFFVLNLALLAYTSLKIKKE